MVRKISLSVLFIASILLAACAPGTAQEPISVETQPVETLEPESVAPTETIPPTEIHGGDWWRHDPAQFR